MRMKKEYSINNHGYRTSLFGSLIPGGLHIYYNNEKIKEQIKDIYRKEQDYINEMTGECVTYNIKDKE